MNEISKFQILFVKIKRTDDLSSRISTLHCDIGNASVNARDIKFSYREEKHKYQHDSFP